MKLFEGESKPWLQKIRSNIEEKYLLLNSPDYQRRQQSVLKEKNPLFKSASYIQPGGEEGIMYDLSETELAKVKSAPEFDKSFPTTVMSIFPEGHGNLPHSEVNGKRYRVFMC